MHFLASEPMFEILGFQMKFLLYLLSIIVRRYSFDRMLSYLWRNPKLNFYFESHVLKRLAFGHVFMSQTNQIMH